MFDSVGGRHRLHTAQRPTLDCTAFGCHAKSVGEAPVPLCADHLRKAFAYVLETERPDLSEHADVQPYWSQDPTPTGFVYFIRLDGLVKIGYSRNPATRFRTLCPSEVLHVQPGTMRDERRCHAAFAHLRVYGEMFRPEPDLLAFIDGLRQHAA